MSGQTLSAIINRVIKKFQAAHIDNAELEARILCEWATNTKRIDAVITPNKIIEDDIIEKIDDAVKRRVLGEPVYRIIGKREFYGLEFVLSKDTLEPRQDTETLIDLVLPVLTDLVKKNNAVHILDMGTGSGAIAITLLTLFPTLAAVGVDISSDALKTACQNADLLGGGDRFQSLLSNWFDEVQGQYDLIISNPPYIAQKEIEFLANEVRLHDPMRALIAGNDGLEFYQKLAQNSASYLKPHGFVAVEIGMGQEQDVIRLFEEQNFICIEMLKDLGNIIRALLFVKKTHF